jgi:hypothetical protein
LSTVIQAYVSKSGGNCFFFAVSGTPQKVTNITAHPTVSVNGTAVPIWGPIWAPSSNNLPFAMYQLNCGPVRSVIVQQGGSGYSAPVATVSGGGGSGCVLGAPQMASGVITSIPVTAGGSGYTSAPTVTITDAAGTGAMANAIILGGVITSILVTTGGVNYRAPTASLSGGGGSGGTLGTPVVSSGVITSIPVIAAGTGYTSPPSIVITDQPGFTPPTNAIRRGPGRYRKRAGADRGQQTWRAASSPAGAGSGATAVPVMGGVRPGDTVTYTATAGWLTAASGAAPSASGDAITNYSGLLEPGVGGYLGFDYPPSNGTLGLGFNLAWPTSDSFNPYNNSANWMHRSVNPWTNAVTSTIDGHPLTITGTASTTISLTLGNYVDAHNYPSQTGIWTFIADDTNPGNQMTVALSGGGNAVITPLGNAGLVNSGTLVGGVQVGKVWQWNVQRSSNPAVSWGLAVGITAKVTGAVGTYPYTLTNEWMATPLATAAAAPGYPARVPVPGADQALLNWLTTPGGHGPAILRSMDSAETYGGNGMMIDAIDLQKPTDFSWAARVRGTDGPAGTRDFNIVAFRTYAPGSTGWPAAWNVTWTSPNVLLNAWNVPAGGTVRSVTVTGGGSGYAVANPPVCTVVGGGGAECSLGVPTIVGGAITSIPLWNGGSGYTTPPSISITGGVGSGATATCTIADLTKGIDSILVSTGGSNYTAPTATVSGGGGSGCVLGVPTVVVGAITSIPVTSPGSGYTTAPAVTITDATGSGCFATAIAGFPAIDPSWIDWSGKNTTTWFAVEAVTDVPHHLKTGQNIKFKSGLMSMQVSDGPNTTVTCTHLDSSIGQPVFVTGPTTFAFTTITSLIHAGTAVGTLPGDMNNVAGNFPVSPSVVMTVQVPDPSTMPYEVAAQISGSFPNCNHWVNVPLGATDLCVAEIARRVRDNLPPGRRVYVEYANENWNFTPNKIFSLGMGVLGAFGYAGQVNTTYPYALRASQVHKIFVDTFNLPDINNIANRGGEIYRLFGAQFIPGGSFDNVMKMANSYNASGPVNPIQIDGVCVAPYVDILSEVRGNPAVVATVNVTGGGSVGGLLSPGNYYVAFTYIDTLTGKETIFGSSRSVQFTVALGNIPRVTIGALPAWAASANIYLTPPGGAIGSEVQYASGITTTTYDLAAFNTGTIPPQLVNQIPHAKLAVASLACGKPLSIVPGWPTPFSRASVLDYWRHYVRYTQLYNGTADTSNFGHYANQLATYVPQGSQPTGFRPAIVGYEGGIQSVVAFDAQIAPDSGGFYLNGAITHDLAYDPAIYDCEMAVYQMLQQGGMSVFAPYSLCQIWVGGASANSNGCYVWGHVTWAGQPAGRGDGSGTTTDSCLGPAGTPVTNRYWIDDGSAHHLHNASVMLQGWRDWVDLSAPVFKTPLSWRPQTRPIKGPAHCARYG